jgi:hypothetical protein
MKGRFVQTDADRDFIKTIEHVQTLSKALRDPYLDKYSDSGPAIEGVLRDLWEKLRATAAANPKRPGFKTRLVDLAFECPPPGVMR